MIQFGITKQLNPKKQIRPISLVFAFCVILMFSIFVFYNKITLFLLEKDKIDIFKEDLQQIAIYFLPVDKQVAQFLVTLDSIIKGYIAGENILISKEKEIDEVRDYTKKNKEYLKKLGFANYDKIIDLFADLRNYKSEFFALLGKNKPYNYLVILQNTNEKRPNGGFFGSFAFVTIDQGHIKNLEIVDSYYPDFIAYRTRILAPERTSSFLPDRKIGFIAGNKFGFTDIDGKNLKELYEKMFNETYEMRKVEKTMTPDLYNKLLNQYIKGVIFIRSDMIEQSIPGFQEKIREWQFLNASVDLIRGELRGNKKEKYIQEVKDFFDKNKVSIIRNFVNNFADITEKQAVNIRLSNVSTGFQNVIEKNNLINTFDTGYIYAWDTNVSYDKVDGFVNKTIEILDSKGNVVIEQNGDIIDIKSLKPDIYTMTISYSLDIPQNYIDLIAGFEKKYNIKLTDRERGILAIQPTLFEDPKRGKVRKRRETKSTVYIPTNCFITKVQGDIFYQEKFTTPFSNGLFYQMGINENHKSKKINITFEVK